MYCYKCGNKLYDEAKYCQSCGAPANISSINHAIENDEGDKKDNIKPEHIDNTTSNSKKFNRVGGWLILPIIFFLVLRPIAVFVSFWVDDNSFNSYWVLIDSVITIYYIYAGILLLQKKSKAPKHAIRVYIINIISTIVWLISAFIWNETHGYVFENYQWLWNTIIGILMSFVWILYFKKSVRVEITYKKK